MKPKLRFKIPDPAFPHCADVYAVRRSTGKWEKIGECHAASIPILKESTARLPELVRITVQPSN